MAHARRSPQRAPTLCITQHVLPRPLEPEQYTAIRYADRLADADIAASIGSVGDSYDNAMAEALNGTFKAELIYLHGPWRTRTSTELAIVEWIDWYNSARLHSSIGDIPPLEYETHWYLRNNTPADLVGTH